MDFQTDARDELFAREELLIGKEGLEMLANSCVAVFGLGGVGGNCAEALARAGVGRLILVDNDRVCLSNLNRQLFATLDTVGMLKTEAAAERLAKVNPFCKVTALDMFFGEDTADRIDWESVDFICDAVDTVSAKVLLAATAQEKGIGIISSMGTGNKFEPSAFRIADISATSYCPLARVMRRLLKERGIKKLNVVYSEEVPVRTGSRTPGSISFVPPAAGLIMAGFAVNSILNKRP